MKSNRPSSATVFRECSNKRFTKNATTTRHPFSKHADYFMRVWWESGRECAGSFAARMVSLFGLLRTLREWKIGKQPDNVKVPNCSFDDFREHDKEIRQWSTQGFATFGACIRQHVIRCGSYLFRSCSKWRSEIIINLTLIRIMAQRVKFHWFANFDKCTIRTGRWW